MTAFVAYQTLFPESEEIRHLLFTLKRKELFDSE